MTCCGARLQIVKKAKKIAKKIADHYSDPLDLTASLATLLASVIHVRRAILTSRSHIMSPQGSPCDAKNDLSHRCATRTMGEVELSSALAPLSRCRIPSPLAGMPSIARRRILATLSAGDRAECVASCSLGVPEQSGAAHRHEHVDHEHDMHGSMAGRSRADLRWWAHLSQAKGASARAPSNIVPCGCKQALASPRWRVGCSSAIASITIIALGRVTQTICSWVSLEPRFRRPMPCRGCARAFDRGLLHFSEKQPVHVHNVYLAVQHVNHPHRSAPTGLVLSQMAVVLCEKGPVPIFLNPNGSWLMVRSIIQDIKLTRPWGSDRATLHSCAVPVLTAKPVRL